MNSNAKAGAESPFNSPPAGAIQPAPPERDRISYEDSEYRPRHDPEAEDLLRRYLRDKHSYRLEGNLALRELEGRLANRPEADAEKSQPVFGDASAKMHNASLIQPSLAPYEQSGENADLSHRLSELSAYLHADLTKREAAWTKHSEMADQPPRREETGSSAAETPQPQNKRQKSNPDKPVLDRMWFEERFAALRSSIDEISDKQPGSNRRLDLLERQFQKLMERMEAREAADRSHSNVQAGLKELAVYLEDSKQWNITQNVRLRGVEEKIDRLSTLLARSHEAISATAKGLELVAQGTGRKLAEETAMLVSHTMDAKLESLNVAQPFDELSREVASLSMQTRQSARSTDEKIKTLQGRLESSLKRLGLGSGAEGAQAHMNGDDYSAISPSAFDDGDGYEHKLFGAAQRAARLAGENGEELSHKGEPIRYQIPYGEFLPDEERSHSHIGLVVAAIILLLASGAMLYLNLSSRKPAAPPPKTETSDLSMKQNPLRPAALTPVTTASIPQAERRAAQEDGTAAKLATAGKAWSTETTTATLTRALPAAEPLDSLQQVTMIGLSDKKSESLRKAAVEGDVSAQFSIGQTYLHGDDLASGLPQQERLFVAARWFRRAAEKGHAESQFRLATLYELGQGVYKDADQAQIWYQRAAKQGHVKAMHNLAVLSIRGNGRPKDYPVAALWFTHAADQGLPESQYNLALLYERGLGVERDLEQAYRWVSLAAQSGDEKSALKRAKLAQQLPEEQRARIDRDNATWVSAPADLETVGMPERAPTPKQPASAASAAAPEATSWSTQVTVQDSPVATVQKLLQTLGYKPGPVDGIFGPRTAAAIREFESKSGLQPSGQVSETLLAKLASAQG